jgi:PAP2 superfamily
VGGTRLSARTEEARPPRRRFTGLLPDQLLRYRRPRWWQEVLVIAIGYTLYDLGRNAVPKQESIAMRHGRSVEHLQHVLNLDFELSVNQFVARNEWLAQVMDYYYATLHFIVTAGVLIWLFRAHPAVFRGVRTVLFATTLIALLGFYLYPLAPPRLLPQYGYIDTLVKFHTWGSLADPKIAAHSNQFAAMPSLHIGWALWCGIAFWRMARRQWVRIAGLLYPFGTLMVIVGTANHFILDAVGGAAVLALAFGVQWLMSGHGAFTPAPGAPGTKLPAPRQSTP